MVRLKKPKIDNSAILTTFYESVLDKRELDQHDIKSFRELETHFYENQIQPKAVAIQCAHMFTEILLKWDTLMPDIDEMWHKIVYTHDDLCAYMSFERLEALVQDHEECVFHLTTRFAHILQPFLYSQHKISIRDVAHMVHSRFSAMTISEQHVVTATCVETLKSMECYTNFDSVIYNWVKPELDVSEADCEDEAAIERRIRGIVTQADANPETVPLLKIMNQVLQTEFEV